MRPCFFTCRSGSSFYLFKEIQVREIITLECQVCKRRNYTTNKEKRNNPDRLVIKKYCKWCKKHTEHKETK